MFRVSVVYPNEPGKKFDMDYWVKKHRPMVNQKLGGIGLIRAEADKGVGTVQPGAPAPFVAVSHMYFDSMADIQKCLPLAAEMMADIPNFTNIQPRIQISEIME